MSQCGYNTTLDLLRTGVPALVVPFAEGGEDEQTRRAERLERLGAVRVLEAGRARRRRRWRPRSASCSRSAPSRSTLDLDGARTTALIVGNMLARAAAPPPDPARRLLGIAS